MSEYGYSINNPKIDLFYDGIYEGSTYWSKANKEATQVYIEKHSIPKENQHLVKAKRSK